MAAPVLPTSSFAHNVYICIDVKHTVKIVCTLLTMIFEAGSLDILQRFMKKFMKQSPLFKLKVHAVNFVNLI